MTTGAAGGLATTEALVRAAPRVFIGGDAVLLAARQQLLPVSCRVLVERVFARRILR